MGWNPCWMYIEVIWQCNVAEQHVLYKVSTFGQDALFGSTLHSQTIRQFPIIVYTYAKWMLKCIWQGDASVPYC